MDTLDADTEASPDVHTNTNLTPTFHSMSPTSDGQLDSGGQYRHAILQVDVGGPQPLSIGAE